MLFNDHRKAGKELQRKIAKLREENKDPTLPQKPSKMPATAASKVAAPAPQPVPSPPPQTLQNRMSDSQQAVDESFMLLGQRVRLCHDLSVVHAQCLPAQSEPGDAFNHFWKITEGMLDYLSQPVAFATAPLSPPDAEGSGSRRRENGGSDTETEDPISKTLSRGLGFVKSARSKMLLRQDSAGNMQSDGISTFPPKPQPIDDWDEEIYDGSPWHVATRLYH